MLLNVRFDSKYKMKTSLLMGPSKDRFSVDCSDKANLSEQFSVTFSVISAEMTLKYRKWNIMGISRL